MNRLRQIFALPLLAKELTESSARWRTYGARVLFAIGLYVLVAFFLPRDYWAPSSGATAPFEMLGAGSRIFEAIAAIQTLGIALFLPAMMCGCITREKERDSLVLLLLTALRPWQILLQKYLGGMVPVLSLLLLSAPLMAVAYSLGGLEAHKLFEQSLGVGLLALELGALTLLSSVWCRTTVAALLSSYLLGALMFVAPVLITFSTRTHSSSISENLVFLFVPPALFEITDGDPLRDRVLALLPSVLAIFVFLGLAWFFFLRRAFVPPSGFLRRTFRRLDAFMQRANRLTGHIVLIRDAGNLPADAPIFWRETRTRALGRPHYLLRFLVVAQGVTVLLCLLVALGNDRDLGQLSAFLSGLAALVVAVQAANVIVSERVNQTLEVLLTTSLAAAQIVREKERALWRLLLVLAVPLLTVVGVESYLRFDAGFAPYVRYGQPHDARQMFQLYLVSSILAVAIYLPMVVWLAMSIGLWLRTRFHAIIVTLVALAAWCGLPLIVADYFQVRTVMDLARFGEVVAVEGAAAQWRVFPLADLLGLLSPLGVFFREEARDFATTWMGKLPWVVVIVNFTAYGVIALALRTVLLCRADHWLRRG